MLTLRQFVANNLALQRWIERIAAVFITLVWRDLNVGYAFLGRGS